MNGPNLGKLSFDLTVQLSDFDTDKALVNDFS
jgi:hypothetical protein